MPWTCPLRCCLCRVRKISDLIRNTLISVLKMNEVLMDLKSTLKWPSQGFHVIVYTRGYEYRGGNTLLLDHSVLEHSKPYLTPPTPLQWSVHIFRNVSDGLGWLSTPQPSWTLGNIFWRIFLSFGMFCSVAINLSLLNQYLWHKPTLKYVMQKQSLSFSMLFLTTGSLYCFSFQTQCQPDLFWS